jgi:hypothetical protein
LGKKIVEKRGIINRGRAWGWGEGGMGRKGEREKGRRGDFEFPG